MRFILGLITIVASLGAVSGDHCAEGSTDYGGNWFCQPVKAIHYSNVGTPGTYQKITGMSNGVCTSETQLFSGPIAPLDEEVRLTLECLIDNLAKLKNRSLFISVAHSL